MKRVLVVDDEQALCRAIRVILEDSIEVHTANDIASAIKMLSQHFDIVLTDLQLTKGGREGFELLEYLRRTGNPAKRVAMSGKSYLGAEALAAGAHEFIAKPFEISELYGAIGVP